jgi:hypothetical protein
LALSADYDDHELLEYGLFIHNDTRGWMLGSIRALDLLIYGVWPMGNWVLRPNWNWVWN